jgi:hypothetical protein
MGDARKLLPSRNEYITDAYVPIQTKYNLFQICCEDGKGTFSNLLNNDAQNLANFFWIWTIKHLDRPIPWVLTG